MLNKRESCRFDAGACSLCSLIVCNMHIAYNDSPHIEKKVHRSAVVRQKKLIPRVCRAGSEESVC